MTRINGISDNVLYFLFDKIGRDAVTSTEELVSSAIVKGYDEAAVRNALGILMEHGLISPNEEVFSFGINTADFTVNAEFENLLG